MSFFNRYQEYAMDHDEWLCLECKQALMEFEDEEEFVLICPHCGAETDIDHYGYTQDEYDAKFPTEAEFFGRDEGVKEGEEEIYEEELNELDDN